MSFLLGVALDELYSMRESSHFFQTIVEEVQHDEHNRLSNDLRFDVGIDGELAKLAGEFIPLELIYEAAMEKTVGVPFLCPMLAH